MEENKLIIKKSKEFPYSVYEGKDKDTYIIEFIDGEGRQIREEIKAEICLYFNEHIHKLYSQEYSANEINLDELDINNISADLINSSFQWE